jgi:hypothetical protein
MVLVFHYRSHPRTQEDSVENQVDLPAFGKFQSIRDGSHFPNDSEGTIAPVLELLRGAVSDQVCPG